MTEAVEKAEAKLDRPLGQKNQPVAEGGLERKFRTSKEKLTSPWATGAAIVIAVIWTILSGVEYLRGALPLIQEKQGTAVSKI